MNKKCKVLIIGGGIAGSTAFTVLNKLNIGPVTLCETSKNIGSSHSRKIDFAEDKGLKEELEKYDLPCYKETNVSRYFSPNGELFEFHSIIRDIWFKRGSNDSYERNLLKNNDESILLNSTVREIKNGIVRVDCKTSGEKLTFQPEYIIVASGNSTAPFNMDKEKKIIDLYHTKGFAVDTIDIEPDIPHIFFDKKIFRSSYMYMVNHKKENIGYLAYGTNLKNGYPINFLQENKQFGKLLENSHVIDTIHGSIYFGKHSQLVNGNMLFVGDAANLMDPLFSYGVTPSVRSAVFAAESISKGKDVMNQYKKRVKKEILPEIYQHFMLRKVFDSLSNKDIDVLIHILKQINENVTDEDVFDNVGKLLLNIAVYTPQNKRLFSILYKGAKGLV